jgi:hypothetical protein
MRSAGTSAVNGAPRVVSGRRVPRRRRSGTKRKLGLEARGRHGPTVGVVLVVSKVDAAVVPRVAVASRRFEAGKGCLGSVAGSVLEQGPG